MCTYTSGYQITQNPCKARLNGYERLRANTTRARLIVRDLDDTAMLQIMARENLEEWGISAEVEHETVSRATASKPLTL